MLLLASENFRKEQKQRASPITVKTITGNGEGTPHGPVTEFTEYLIYTPVGAPGVNHTYTIFWDDYYTSLDVKIDATVLGQSFKPTGYYSNKVDVGGEVSLLPENRAGSYLSPTYPTYMQIFNTNGYWYFWKDAGGSAF